MFGEILLYAQISLKIFYVFFFLIVHKTACGQDVENILLHLLFPASIIQYLYQTLKRKNMNIFKTFEIFLKEPLSILRDNFIQIVSIQTGNIFENKPSVDVSLLKHKAQLTVVNNEK